MYVITDHNNGNFVILGPVQWKPRYMSDVLFDEVQEEVALTREDEARVPFEILPGIKIRRCDVVYERVNEKIERLEGPHWIYDDTNSDVQAVATWKCVDKPVDQVKSELKAQLADLRWQRENVGITLTIQGVEVWCDTSRGNRDIFFQKYALMSDSDVVRWKFQDNTWLDLTKSELGYIVTEGVKYIQGCFDWEAQWVETINSCTTLAELDSLVFEDVDGQ